MRKLLLTVFALVLMSASCFAANWEWIGSDENLGVFYDTDSVRFAMSRESQIVNRDRFWVWVKFVYDEGYAARRGFPRGVKYCMTKLWLDTKQFRVCEERKLFYDTSNSLVASRMGKWEDIIPGSAGEVIMKHIEKYVRAHEEEIEQRTRGAR
jgi:hypothetical protein